MSITPTPAPVVPPRMPHRHALGMPAGSVRALLALVILGLLWLLAIKPPAGADEQGRIHLPSMFLYLLMLMLLILAHFFAAHGGSIRPGPDERSPLGLPRGSVRFLLMCGFLGLFFYMYRHRETFVYPSVSNLPLNLALLLTGFFLGHIITGVVKRTSHGALPYPFQDFQAWVALLAMIALGVLVVIQIFINPGLDPSKQIEPGTVEGILAALVGFYFGSRS